ncbi:hypothetical protein A1OK_19405 [Enterovibrio norvegicus FF-454]|uniref:Uncharacterized protein n=1 Tax=Enterovibrio norvegicus FF-454 TaxID=1185651 RepID=A0A1E5CB73_9GAMM|nr:hypothetical protein [Enterovibrio norvegicus]OEE62758.1 hypothetical protein A1OK_19405 [Enterovibrio norvegicus FF-454]
MKRLWMVVALVSVGLGVFWFAGTQDNAPQRMDLLPANSEEKRSTMVLATTGIANVKRDVSPRVETAPTEEKVVVSEAMSAQFSRIAQTFESELNYPPYSQPIVDLASPYLTPNHFAVVEMPVLDGKHSAALVVDKYRYFFPEPIAFRVKSGLPVTGMKFDLIDIDTREVVASGNSENAQGKLTAKENWPANVRLRVKVQFAGGGDVLTADVNYQNPVAYLLGAQPAYVQGADWTIPLDIDAKKAGLYRVRANLYRVDGRPVAVLTSKQRLTEGESVMDVKAHQSVFGGESGEYQLRDIQVERMSGSPGEKTRYGVSNVSVIELGPFNANSLSEESYQPSEQERQQLLFLKSLSGEV